MMVLHKQEKPYKRSQCGKNLRRQSTLSRHQGLHILKWNLRGRHTVMPVGVQKRGKNNGKSMLLQKAQPSTDISSRSRVIVKPNPRSRLHLRKPHDEWRKPPLQQEVKTLRVVLTKLDISRKDKTSQDLETEQQNGPRKNQNQRAKGQGASSQGKGETMKKYGRHNPGKKKHLCSECGHMAYNLSDLLKHMKTHLNKELYKCPECGKTYKGQTSFEAHKKTHAEPDHPISVNRKIRSRSWKHQTEDRYICSECGVSKNTLASLTEHMMVLHKDEKLYECPQCSKTFRWQSTLSRHKKLHILKWNLRERRRVMPVGVQKQGKNNGNSVLPQKAQHSTGIISRSPVIFKPNPRSRLHLRKPHDVGSKPPFRREVKTLRVMLTKLNISQKGVQKQGKNNGNSLPLEEAQHSTDSRSRLRLRKQHKWRKPPLRREVKTLRVVLTKLDISQKGEGEKSGETETFPNQEINMEDEALRVMSNPPEEDAEKESMDHQSEKYLCTQCGHTAEKWLDLVKHKCFDTVEKPFKCNDCGKNFASLLTLVKHQKTHASQQQTASQVPAAPIAECDVTLSESIKKPRQVKEGNPQPKKTGSPPVAVTKGESSMLTMIWEQWRYKKKEENGKNDWPKDAKEDLSEKEAAVRARLLRFAYSKSAETEQDRTQVSSSDTAQVGEKPFYKCLTCGESFEKITDLTDHESTHTGPSDYNELWKYFFWNDISLMDQPACMELKPQNCCECGKDFFCKDNLVIHLKTHGFENIYECPECEECFVQQEQLARHQQSHVALEWC